MFDPCISDDVRSEVFGFFHATNYSGFFLFMWSDCSALPWTKKFKAAKTTIGALPSGPDRYNPKGPTKPNHRTQPKEADPEKNNQRSEHEPNQT